MFLETILESKKIEVGERAARVSLSILERRATLTTPRDLLSVVRRPGLGVIAEVKRASPSRGPIRADLDAELLAREYQDGGCIAVSVLTDERYFGAKPDDLPRVRAAVSVPVLRKDFIVSEYQVVESRAMGADALLLIVAALGEQRLTALLQAARECGLTPLVEVHTATELDVALGQGAPLIGINNRDLHSFNVDLESSHRLIPLIPRGIPVISESGIHGPREAAIVRSWGADAALVGEALVAGSHPAEEIRAMVAAGKLSHGEPVPDREDRS